MNYSRQQVAAAICMAVSFVLHGAANAVSPHLRPVPDPILASRISYLNVSLLFAESLIPFFPIP